MQGCAIGTIITAVVTIVNDDDLTEVVERVAKLLRLNMDKYREGGRNWKAQFRDAVSAASAQASPGGAALPPHPNRIVLTPPAIDQLLPDGECPSGCVDMFLHFMNVPWNVAFAFCPPTSLCGGWLCFGVSLILIGVSSAHHSAHLVPSEQLLQSRCTESTVPRLGVCRWSPC